MSPMATGNVPSGTGTRDEEDDSSDAATKWSRLPSNVVKGSDEREDRLGAVKFRAR